MGKSRSSHRPPFKHGLLEQSCVYNETVPDVQRPRTVRRFTRASGSSVACILTERGRVHDAIPAGDTVLSTPPGRMKAKVQRSKVLLHSSQPGGSQSTRRSFPFLCL